ncbi:MAG: type II toxin-antitoxin system RelE/ParE family toxin [Schwartzia sp.]|nr:type II toxin-antitoxin system RelE/ParE family toxin [Schwartzia sp. (in: firmicutes)]
MNRQFIEVPLFTKRWAEIGLGNEELRALQIMLLKNPEAGPVIEGTGGIRKVRFPLENRGKSGSVRICYTDFDEYEVTYLITAFTKKEQENLSAAEKSVLKKLVKMLKEEAANNRGR